MAGRRFDISKLSSFATLLFVALLAFMFSVNGYRQGGELAAYTPFQNYIDQFVGQYDMVAIFLNAIIVLYGAILLGKYGIVHYLYPSRCYLAAIFYVVLSMAMGSGGYMFRVYLSALLLIFALGQILKGSNSKRIVGYRWFVCGFWIEIATMFFSGSVIALLAIVVGMMVYRMNAPREYAIAFGGALMVIVMSISTYIILGYDLLGIFNWYDNFYAIPTLPIFSIREWFFVGLTVLVLFLSIIQVVKISAMGRLDLVKGVLFFLILLLVSAFGAVFTQLGSIEGMPIIAIVLSFIMPLYFASSKRRLGFKNLLFFVYLGSAISLAL